MASTPTRPGWPGPPRPYPGWLVAAGLLIGVKSLWLDTLQQYFPFNVQLSATDLVEVIVLAMIIGVVLTGATSLLTLRRYLRA